MRKYVSGVFRSRVKEWISSLSELSFRDFFSLVAVGSAESRGAWFAEAALLDSPYAGGGVRFVCMMVDVVEKEMRGYSQREERKNGRGDLKRKSKWLELYTAHKFGNWPRTKLDKAGQVQVRIILMIDEVQVPVGSAGKNRLHLLISISDE